MASAIEERNRLDELIRAGKGEETVHIVYTDRIAKERAENKGPRPKTRFIMETHSSQAYALLNKERDRVIRRVGNLTIAIDLLIRSWQELDDSKIKAWLSEGE